MNLPNKLTIFRIILVPIMVIIPFFNIDGEMFNISITWLLIDLIFIIASITDKLDGYLARSRNEVTTFGKFLDPIADKILVLAAMIMLVEATKLPAWIPIIVLFREFIVSGYRLIAVGKFLDGSLSGINLIINIASTTMLLISVIATIFSGWEYIKNGKDLLSDK